jgi:tRNA(Ile)-lysidine synthase
MREQGKLGQGRFFRPLLAAQRQQLLDYLASNDVLWLEDPSNQDQSLTRNFLRHRVIQPLLSRWPGVADAVVRVAQRQQAQYSLLQELLADAQDQVSLNRLPESRSNRRVWLRVFLELRGHFAVTDKAIDEFCRQLNDAAVSRLALDSDSTLLAWREHLYYESAMGSYAESPALEQTPLKPGEPIVFAGRQWSLVAAQRSEVGSFCCSDSLSISARRADLVMQWHGRQVGIDDLLRDLRIPPWRRASVPLVINEREIVAVADLAVSERYLPGMDAQSYWRLVSS